MDGQYYHRPVWRNLTYDERLFETLQHCQQTSMERTMLPAEPAHPRHDRADLAAVADTTRCERRAARQGVVDISLARCSKPAR